jgi:hypothetical protein
MLEYYDLFHVDLSLDFQNYSSSKKGGIENA